MTNKINPWDNPAWHSIGREASLVQQLIGTGATAIGRANYADKIGDYYVAFFGLSVGIERLAKLILICGHAINNQGQMPAEGLVRKFGHKIPILIHAVDKVASQQNLQPKYQKPNHLICLEIIGSLSRFADAGTGRYANFAALSNPHLGQNEPIRDWWTNVCEACRLECATGHIGSDQRDLVLVVLLTLGQAATLILLRSIIHILVKMSPLGTGGQMYAKPF